jgi:enoyl-[acyl-carrier protein] reductase I
MTDLLKGKRGLVMGVANERSIAWGIARAMADEGAELAFSYQGEAFGKRVEPLAASVGSNFLVDVDVMNDASLDACFTALKDRWGKLDFLVHAIAFSDKNELTGRFINTSRENFKTSLCISCFSFIDVSRRASELMPDGGTLLTLTFQGSNRVTPNYNVMGVAKAALESAVRYLANDLGPQKIRVNAISPGPMKTLAGAAIGGARATFRQTEANAPLRSNATLEAVGGTAVYLASDWGAFTTGEIVRVDGGYHVLGMPQAENSERLEGHRGQRPHDPRNVEQPLRQEMPHILVIGDIDLGDQVIFPAGGIKLAHHLAVIDGIGHLIGLAGGAAELDENAAHHGPPDLGRSLSNPAA